jgi:hypothetical protein
MARLTADVTAAQRINGGSPMALDEKTSLACWSASSPRSSGNVIKLFFSRQLIDIHIYLCFNTWQHCFTRTPLDICDVSILSLTHLLPTQPVLNMRSPDIKYTYIFQSLIIGIPIDYGGKILHPCLMFVTEDEHSQCA